MKTVDAKPVLGYMFSVAILTRHRWHAQEECCIIENNAFIISIERLV